MSAEGTRSMGLSLEEKRALARRLLARAGGPAATPPAVEPAPPIGPVPVETGLASLEGIAHLRAQQAELRRLGIANPYFRGHQTVNADTVLMDGRSYLNFSGYNYLGLSGHSEVAEAAKAAIDRYGTSVSASRVASGEVPLHRELEGALADLVGAQDAIVFVSGYGANVAVLGHLFGSEDAIFHDVLIHRSALVGCQLSGARRLPFRHNDCDHLEALLREHRGRFRRALILVEGVYSMDGDIPDLPRIVDLKKRHQAMVMIDEAHSIGVLGATGRGIGEHFGIDPADVELWMGTLSKSLASCGGYLAGSRALVEYLKYTAPGFVYSVGLTPPDAAAALAAITVMRREPERVRRVRDNAALFLARARERGLDTGCSGGAAVAPVIVGDSVLALRLAERLAAQGINVQPIFYPAVEESAARLRFFIGEGHDPQRLGGAADTVADTLAALRREPPVSSPVFGEPPA